MAAHRSYPAGRAGCRRLIPAAETAGPGERQVAAITGSRLARWAWLPRIATRAPGADPGSVRAARDVTVTTRHQRGMAERSPDIAIVVPELMTNALRHALPGSGDTRPRRPIRLGLLQPGPCMLCAVADPDKTAPAPRTPGSSTRPAADCTSSARSATSGAAPRPARPERSCGPCSARGRHRQPRPGTRADQAATGRRTWQPGRTSQCERSVAGRLPDGHRALACDHIHRSRVDNYLMPIRSRPPS